MKPWALYNYTSLVLAPLFLSVSTCVIIIGTPKASLGSGGGIDIDVTVNRWTRACIAGKNLILVTTLFNSSGSYYGQDAVFTNTTMSVGAVDLAKGTYTCSVTVEKGVTVLDRATFLCAIRGGRFSITCINFRA